MEASTWPISFILKNLWNWNDWNMTFLKRRKIWDQSNEDILCSSVWLNKNVGTENILFLNLLKHGVHIIGDLLSSDGDILNINDLKKRYNCAVNILNCYTISLDSHVSDLRLRFAIAICDFYALLYAILCPISWIILKKFSCHFIFHLFYLFLSVF